MFPSQAPARGGYFGSFSKPIPYVLQGPEPSTVLSGTRRKFKSFQNIPALRKLTVISFACGRGHCPFRYHLQPPDQVARKDSTSPLGHLTGLSSWHCEHSCCHSFFFFSSLSLLMLLPSLATVCRIQNLALEHPAMSDSCVLGQDSDIPGFLNTIPSSGVQTLTQRWGRVRLDNFQCLPLHFMGFGTERICSSLLE